MLVFAGVIPDYFIYQEKQGRSVLQNIPQLYFRSSETEVTFYTPVNTAYQSPSKWWRSQRIFRRLGEINHQLGLLCWLVTWLNRMRQANCHEIFMQKLFRELCANKPWGFHISFWRNGTYMWEIAGYHPSFVFCGNNLQEHKPTANQPVVLLGNVQNTLGWSESQDQQRSLDQDIYSLSNCWNCCTEMRRAWAWNHQKPQ